MMIYQDLESMEEFPGEMLTLTLVAQTDFVWEVAQKKGFSRGVFDKSLFTLLQHGYLAPLNEQEMNLEQVETVPSEIRMTRSGYSAYSKNKGRKPRN